MGIFMKETIVQLIAAGMGTLGYGVLFRLRTKHMVTAVIGGVMTWGIYLIFANVIEGVFYPTLIADRKSTRLNSSHDRQSRMPSSA